LKLKKGGTMPDECWDDLHAIATSINDSLGLKLEELHNSGRDYPPFIDCIVVITSLIISHNVQKLRTMEHIFSEIDRKVITSDKLLEWITEAAANQIENEYWGFDYRH